MIGDHIRARKGGRWTHAIDCGDQTVLFLRDGADVPPADRITRSYRPEFVADAETVEVVTHRERVYPPRQVVARAYSRTRDTALAVMFRDSEAFAEWCKSGRLPAGYNYAVSVPGAVKAARPPAATKPAAKAKVAAKPKAAAQAKIAAKATVAAKPGAIAKAKLAAKPKAAAKAKLAARPKAAAKAKAAAKPAPKVRAKAKAARSPRATKRLARKPAKVTKGKRR